MRCGSCDQPKVKIGGEEYCKNNRCIKYPRYYKVRCPECSCAPVDVESVSGTASARFRCSSDHIFSSAAATWSPMPGEAPAPAAATPVAAPVTPAAKGSAPKSAGDGSYATSEIRDLVDRLETELKKRASPGASPSGADLKKRDQLIRKRGDLIKELESVVLELATLGGH